MNKSELIEQIAARCKVTKTEAAKVLNAALAITSEAVENGDYLTPLLTKLTPGVAPVRTGRNPRAKIQKRPASIKKLASKKAVSKKPAAKVAKKPAPKFTNVPTGGGGPGKKR